MEKQGMEDQIIECLPNFSEARRPEVVDQIVREIQSVNQVVMLERHSDLDHNRTILSFIGKPQAVEEAAFRAIRKAMELIDLNQHTGHHPRIGAADVVPFVPIRNVSMEECIGLSRRLAERVGVELNLPVYLYDQSAIRDDRQNLEDLRQGEYEHLKTAILNNPKRAPDFGPSLLGPAGAVIIGARNHLVTLNVYLATSNLETAHRVAGSIHNSSGGLRFVQAAGVPLDGKAVISLVLMNYQRTRLSRVLEMIDCEAARLGTHVEYTRVVGLIPLQVVLDSAAWNLKLDQIQPEQILETHLEQACQNLIDHQPRTDFLDRLSSTSPTPAGGSAAAYTGAQAAALVSMVAGITLTKKKYSSVHELMNTTLQEAAVWQKRLADFVEIDASTYEQIILASRLPQQTPTEQETRTQKLEQASYQSAEVPLECASITLQVMKAALILAENANINTIGDAAAAAALAQSAIMVFTNNIRLNLKSYSHQDRAARMIGQAAEIRSQAEQYFVQVQHILQTRGGI